jgi:type IV pilus assembly protein PilA
MKNYRDMEGFTLIELMVVISIIGILAGIAIPNFNSYRNRAKFVEVLTLVEPVKKNVAEYYDRWGEFPQDNARAGLPPSRAYIGRVVGGISVRDGIIYVEVTERSDSERKLVWLQPATVVDNPTGPIVWLCMESAMPEGFKSHGTVKEYFPPLEEEMRPYGCR